MGMYYTYYVLSYNYASYPTLFQIEFPFNILNQLDLACCV
jgi:hypothetical protein